MEVINALGRRKTAVARIYVKAGSGTLRLTSATIRNISQQASFTTLLNNL